MPLFFIWQLVVTDEGEINLKIMCEFLVFLISAPHSEKKQDQNPMSLSTWSANEVNVNENIFGCIEKCLCVGKWKCSIAIAAEDY